LGDSVLSLIINTKLFENFPEDTEAHLTMRKISLVRQEHLAQVALEIGLDKAVLIGRGEEKMWGRNKESVLTDTLEAIIGWMYLDLWRSHTQEFVLKYVYRNIGYGSLSLKSYKSLIQEYFQKLHNIPPVYEDIAHEIDQYGNVRTFKSIISCNGIIWPVGYGSNKKKAQESAAKLRYEELTT
jgi:ribonuclease-3